MERDLLSMSPPWGTCITKPSPDRIELRSQDVEKPDPERGQSKEIVKGKRQAETNSAQKYPVYHPSSPPTGEPSAP